MAPTARFCEFPHGSNQEEFHPGSCKGHSTLPPKPFGHLKNQRETHYMNRHNLSLDLLLKRLFKFTLFTISNLK